MPTDFHWDAPKCGLCGLGQPLVAILIPVAGVRICNKCVEHLAELLLADMDQAGTSRGADPEPDASGHRWSISIQAETDDPRAKDQMLPDIRRRGGTVRMRIQEVDAGGRAVGKMASQRATGHAVGHVPEDSGAGESTSG